MSIPHITVWAEQDSPRLRYVLNWLLRERLGLDYSLTFDKQEAATTIHCIAYGYLENTVSIHAASLLWETGSRVHEIVRKEWKGMHALYFDETSPCDIPFDMISGIFYLLSRYEEYFPFSPDRHGRYPADESILFKDGVLERPLVDEWVETFRQLLNVKWNIVIPAKKFRWEPTYDIDIAWSYRQKGWRRSIGGALKDLVSGRWKQVQERILVSTEKLEDPYDAFAWLAEMHKANGIRPIWFFLAALQPSRFDKNIHPMRPRMAALIRSLSEGAETGIHPSYYSDTKPERLIEEKAALESIIGRPASISRQHFIRLRFPETYHALLSNDIEDDYSMGYSTQLGFRAGTGSSFLWYDLSAEKTNQLRIHPFVFMDTTAHFDLGLAPDAAFSRLRKMAELLVRVNGSLLTVMHNFSLGTDAAWKGWRWEYERFVNDIALEMGGGISN